MPELDRIHLHEIRELVHHDLGDERSLRVARRAHRPLQAGVDEHVLVRAAPVVGRSRVVDVGQREARVRTGAAGAPRLGVERRDLAVGGDARLDLRRRGRTVAGHEMLFLAIERHLHRHARLLREPRANQSLGAELQLAAEAAAHVLTDDADVRLRNLRGRWRSCRARS